MRRRRIIIEHDVPDNMDIDEYNQALVPLLHKHISSVVYIGVEDAKEPDNIAGYRNPSKRKR